MNSTGSVYNSSSHFARSDFIAEATGGSRTSCTDQKQTTARPGQCFLTHSNHATAPMTAERERDASAPAASPGDLAFAQKCADLHSFIHPLLGLLHGLKSGRFDKGLTGFQQSVAIDRLQRILGVLQKPDMGGKYLQSLLQIEVMLKIWFPQKNTKTDQTKATQLSNHWCQNQRHIPVKKRKMSWTDPYHSDAVSVKHKHLKQEKHSICDAVTSLNAVSCCPERDKEKAHKASTNRRVELSCANGLEFIDITSSNKEDKVMHCRLSPPSPATQDNSVSSSSTTADSP